MQNEEVKQPDDRVLESSEAHELVMTVFKDIKELQAKHLASISKKQRVLLWGRIVSLLFCAHYKPLMHLSAEESKK